MFGAWFRKCGTPGWYLQHTSRSPMRTIGRPKSGLAHVARGLLILLKVHTWHSWKVVCTTFAPKKGGLRRKASEPPAPLRFCFVKKSFWKEIFWKKIFFKKYFLKRKYFRTRFFSFQKKHFLFNLTFKLFLLNVRYCKNFLATCWKDTFWKRSIWKMLFWEHFEKESLLRNSWTFPSYLRRETSFRKY